MKAIVQTGERSVEVRERSRPTPEPDEVLVRVEAAGLCGSDAHAYKIVDGFEWIPIPRVMGHEYAGTVVEVGSDVADLEPGSQVVEEPTARCGECRQCESGQENVCRDFSVIGVHGDGAYAEYRTTDPEQLFEVPDRLAPAEAALVEPTSVAARAVLSRSQVAYGDEVLVEGPGPIGTLTAAIADASGARVVVSGRETDARYRLPLVEDLGMDTVTVDPEADDASTLRERASDGGFDVVFDATGHRTGVELAAGAVRKGGQIVPIGLPSEPSELFVTDLVRGEIDVQASYGYRWENFQQAVSLISDGAVDPSTVVDESFSPLAPREAFESFLDQRTCKPMFDFTEV